MASSINASTSGAGGVITTADASGNLNIQSGGSTVLALTSSGVAITGTLSATTISGAGGMTLLGTLTTTSGTTQTLSGLTLTNYKYLSISFNNVGYSSGTTNANLLLNTYNIARSGSSTDSTSMYGFNTIDLSSGAAQSSIIVGNVATNTTNSLTLNANTNVIGNLSAINTSTTSLSFTWSSGNTFATGTIKVYGVA